MLEPVATGLAALRVTDADLAELSGILDSMRAAADDHEKLIRFDTAFHHKVVAATGNETLTSLLDGLSGRTVRARVWRGLIDGNAAHTTIDEHQAIYAALCKRDQLLAHASALLHVNTSEAWLRTVLADRRAAQPAPHERHRAASP
jgi:GntR family transcriptional repressor for pyruvate dehydrogenase complex